MDEEAFALTGIAFPVAPTTLGGFTLDGFQWDEFGDDEDEPGPVIVTGTWADYAVTGTWGD